MNTKLFLLVLLAGVSASGASPRLFNSGTDTNGAVLPEGAIDPHIIIVDRTDMVDGTNAYVVPAHALWLPNDSTSGWVCADPDPAAAVNADWTFRVPLDLAGTDPATVTIEARISSDNGILWTKLNGVDIDFTNDAANFFTWAPLTITNGLIAGTNHLDFRLDDFGAVSGFRIEFAGSVTPPPERPGPSLSANGDLTVTGTRLAFYRIEYVDDLSSANWTTLTDFQLLVSPETVDTVAFDQQPQRFYRALLRP